MTPKYSTSNKVGTLLIMCLLATSLAFAQQLVKPTTAKSTTAHNGHEYVDLGLPSGTLWATCNVGANKPEEFGDYFAWGETKTKTNFSWANYKYCMQSMKKLTKYCNDKSYGSNTYSDTYLDILAEDDIARVNLGTSWRMPTKAEFEELKNNCTWTFTTQNGVKGYKVKATNGNSSFLPAAGYMADSKLNFDGTEGYYWSSSLTKNNPSNACYLSFKNGYHDYNDGWRCYGRSLRPVSTNKAEAKHNQTTTTTSNTNKKTTIADKPTTQTAENYSSYSNGHEYVDLGLPSGNLWAICNVGASKIEEGGDCFAWGETETRQGGYWFEYKLCNGNENELTKYNNSDGLLNLKPEDDVAYINWTGSWKMPNKKDFEELIANCTWEYIRVSTGNEGYKGTAKNGKSIYFPVTKGNVDGFYFGNYWTSSLAKDTKKAAVEFSFEGEWLAKGNEWVYHAEMKLDNSLRKNAAAVRPIYNPKQIATTTSKTNQNTTTADKPTTQTTENYSSYSNGHNYVDLGLPSGILWATCNIGANKPEELGDKFAWGETVSKSKYSWTNYTKFGTYSENDQTTFGFNKYNRYDSRTVLEPADDAAHIKWSGLWRMPTQVEYDELISNCTWEWTDNYKRTNVRGYSVTGPNGNSIFIPATEVGGVLDGRGYYWSASVMPLEITKAKILIFNKWDYDCNSINGWNRNYGLYVRAVYQPKQITTNVSEQNSNKNIVEIKSTNNNKSVHNGHEYVDLGLPSGTLWATCNIGAKSPEKSGDYFAWGETKTKTSFEKNGYSYIKNQHILPLNNDAANVNWGGAWRMPTEEEIKELHTECTWTWIDNYNGTGVKGYKVENSNGNSIFLPVTGRKFSNSCSYTNRGYYWSATNRRGDNMIYANHLLLDNSKYGGYTMEKYYGMPIRPVASSNKKEVASITTQTNISNNSGDYYGKQYLLSPKWSKLEIDRANTAKDVAELTQIERDVYLWVNLARLYPRKFAEYEVKNYSYSGILNDLTLYQDLINMLPTVAVYYSRSLTEYAEEWAIISGREGIRGHDDGHQRRRQKICPFGEADECCAYRQRGRLTGKDIVMGLLLDYGVPGLGHRKCILDVHRYRQDRLGVNIQPHIVYDYCCVLDFHVKEATKD